MNDDDEEAAGQGNYTMDGKNENKRGFSFAGMNEERTAEQLQEQYDKFFSKGIQRAPEEVVVYDDVVER